MKVLVIYDDEGAEDEYDAADALVEALLDGNAGPLAGRVPVYLERSSV